MFIPAAGLGGQGAGEAQEGGVGRGPSGMGSRGRGAPLDPYQSVRKQNKTRPHGDMEKRQSQNTKATKIEKHKFSISEMKIYEMSVQTDPLQDRPLIRSPEAMS